jgi:hypothetical protein
VLKKLNVEIPTEVYNQMVEECEQTKMPLDSYIVLLFKTKSKCCSERVIAECFEMIHEEEL